MKSLRQFVGLTTNQEEKRSTESSLRIGMRQAAQAVTSYTDSFRTTANHHLNRIPNWLPFIGNRSIEGLARDGLYRLADLCLNQQQMAMFSLVFSYGQTALQTWHLYERNFLQRNVVVEQAEFNLDGMFGDAHQFATSPPTVNFACEKQLADSCNASHLSSFSAIPRSHQLLFFRAMPDKIVEAAKAQDNSAASQVMDERYGLTVLSPRS